MIRYNYKNGLSCYQPIEKSMAEKVIPLRSRPLDIFIIIMFVFFFLIAYFVDVIAAVSPFGTPQHPGITTELLESYWWAPLRFQYMKWCNLDPAFCANSPWMRTFAAFSPIVYGPFYLIAIYAICKGKNWIRPWALCYAWGLFYSLTVIMMEEFVGETKATDPVTVFLVNMPYWLLVPGLLVYRFWNTSTPFTVQDKRD